MGVNELEEQGPERFDLAATGHVDTAGAKGGHKTEVGSCQREHREKKALLRSVHVGGGYEWSELVGSEWRGWFKRGKRIVFFSDRKQSRLTLNLCQEFARSAENNLD